MGCRKLFRPAIQEVAKGGGKRAYVLHLPERSVLVMETLEPPRTRFQFSLNGQLHDIVHDRLYTRPGRAVSNIVSSLSSRKSMPTPATPTPAEAGRVNPETGHGARDEDTAADNGRPAPDERPAPGTARTVVATSHRSNDNYSDFLADERDIIFPT